MLLKIREATAGKFSYFIVAIISVPFALWGVNYYFQGGFDPVVIEVGSSEIKLSRYNASFNQRKREIEATLDPSLTLPDEAVRRDVIGILVREGLLVQEADEYNYRVSDATLARAIVETPEFLIDGRFDRQLYLDFLNSRRYSQIGFEESVRQRIRRIQLQKLIVQSSFTLPPEQEAYERLFFQGRHVRYIEFPVENYIEPGSIASTRAETFYEENKDLFVEPAIFNLKYIELNVDDIAAGLVVEEEDLRAYYRDHEDLFIMPEQRAFAHILIDPDRHERAEERADEVYEALVRGEDFAELARTYSDDSLTAEKGGELPPLSYGDLDGELQEAVIALAFGEFSEPVASSFGLQIFKLLEAESSGTQSFEAMRDSIEEQVRRARAEELYDESLEQLDTLMVDEWSPLFRIAKALKAPTKYQQDGPLIFTEAEGLFQYPEVKEIAFGLVGEGNSDLLEVGPGHVVVFRVSEDGDGYTPVRDKLYDEVKSEIVSVFLLEDAAVKASDEVNAHLVRLQGREAISLEQLAAEQSLPLHDPGFIRRNSSEVPPEITEITFSLPEIAGALVRKNVKTTKSYAIVQLIAVRKEEIPLWETPELSFGIREFNTVLLGIMEKNAVDIHEDRFGDETRQ